MTTIPTDDISLYALEGHDRDCAEAILSQSRLTAASRIDDIQVRHLLAIGYRAGRAATDDDTVFDRTDRRLGRLAVFLGGASAGVLLCLITVYLLS